MNELVMTVGFPACGKTTYAHSLGYKVFSSDDIRKEYGLTGQTPEENAKVFEILNKDIAAALRRGENCVYDATNLNSRNRRAFLKTIRRLPVHKKCVIFAVTFDEMEQRNASRGVESVPEGVYEKMKLQFQCPNYFEGWDEIAVSYGEQKLENPDYFLSLLNDFEQHNHHHLHTLGYHLGMTEYNIDNVQKQCFPNIQGVALDVIRKAARWHDVGKFYTKKFTDRQGNPTEEVHYYGHENVGAYLYLLYHEGDADCVEVASLISWHMRPIVAWKNEVKCEIKDRRIMGESFYQALQLLSYADQLAH